MFMWVDAPEVSESAWMSAALTTATVTSTAAIASTAGLRASADTRVGHAAGPLSSGETMALSAKFNDVATNTPAAEGLVALAAQESLALVHQRRAFFAPITGGNGLLLFQPHSGCGHQR